MSKYVLIHSYTGCPCCENDPSGTEVDYYNTYEEARKASYDKDDIIAQVVERTPDYITITEDMSIADRMNVQPALGRIQKCDIGKRVYFKNGYAQAENNEQFKKRMERCK